MLIEKPISMVSLPPFNITQYQIKRGVKLREQCALAFKTYWLIMYIRHSLSVLYSFMNTALFS